MNLYEGMFLLDNQAVRADWNGAKSTVTGVLEKHGAKVHTARRWDERKLAFPVKHRKRGTYLLAYYDLETEGIDGLRRDLELSETVLRYLLLRTDEVPEAEVEKGKVELEDGYVPPAPPEDDEPAEEERPAEAAAPAPTAEAETKAEAESEEATADEAKADEAKADEAKADEAKAETETKPEADEQAEKKEEA